MRDFRFIKAGWHAAAGLCWALSAAAIPAPADASQVAGWWGGNWNCTIDGRPARMRWHAADASQSSCDGDACTSTSGARWVGRFSDNGSRWVPLTHPRRGNSGGLFFRHADGNPWYLAQPSNRKTSGWTTWNGKRYPLACWQ